MFQFVEQDRQRPEIADDMVQGQRHYLFLPRAREDRDSHQRASLQIERPMRQFRQTLIQQRLAPARSIFLMKAQFHPLMVLLKGLAVSGGEGSSQTRMSLDQELKYSPERR